MDAPPLLEDNSKEDIYTMDVETEQVDSLQIDSSHCVSISKPLRAPKKASKKAVRKSKHSPDKSANTRKAISAIEQENMRLINLVRHLEAKTKTKILYPNAGMEGYWKKGYDDVTRENNNLRTLITALEEKVRSLEIDVQMRKDRIRMQDIRLHDVQNGLHNLQFAKNAQYAEFGLRNKELSVKNVLLERQTKDYEKELETARSQRFAAEDSQKEIEMQLKVALGEKKIRENLLSKEVREHEKLRIRYQTEKEKRSAMKRSGKKYKTDFTNFEVDDIDLNFKDPAINTVGNESASTSGVRLINVPQLKSPETSNVTNDQLQKDPDSAKELESDDLEKGTKSELQSKLKLYIAEQKLMEQLLVKETREHNQLRSQHEVETRKLWKTIEHLKLTKIFADNFMASTKPKHVRPEGLKNAISKFKSNKEDDRSISDDIESMHPLPDTFYKIHVPRDQNGEAGKIEPEMSIPCVSVLQPFDGEPLSGLDEVVDDKIVD